MSGKGYSQEQILCGLQIIWKEVLGCVSPFDPDLSLIEQMKAEGIYEEIDLYDVFFRLKRDFGFQCAWEEWDTFLGLHVRDPHQWNTKVAPRLTFRALAEFIRERLEPISLEPITILGKSCLTAGIFRALERLAGQVHPKVRRFGPSTPIRTRLRGSHLHTFWNRLRWITKGRVPLPYRITPWRGGFFVLICAAALFLALFKPDLQGLWISSAIAVSLLLPTMFLVELLNRQLNPLPKEIQTFGDLARYLAVFIADQQTEAASCSTP